MGAAPRVAGMLHAEGLPLTPAWSLVWLATGARAAARPSSSCLPLPPASDLSPLLCSMHQVATSAGQHHLSQESACQPEKPGLTCTSSREHLGHDTAPCKPCKCIALEGASAQELQHSTASSHIAVTQAGATAHQCAATPGNMGVEAACDQGARTAMKARMWAISRWSASFCASVARKRCVYSASCAWIAPCCASTVDAWLASAMLCRSISCACARGGSCSAQRQGVAGLRHTAGCGNPLRHPAGRTKYPPQLWSFTIVTQRCTCMLPGEHANERVAMDQRQAGLKWHLLGHVLNLVLPASAHAARRLAVGDAALDAAALCGRQVCGLWVASVGNGPAVHTGKTLQCATPAARIPPSPDPC